jgi:L-aspartate oxidase
MAGRHPLGDLAPRDVVAAAMLQRMAQRGQQRDQQSADGPDDHLWLDATTVGRAVLARDFPTVVGLCRARGINPAAEPIPVAPGAHYACGGIRADLDGRTSLPGLYAAGEAASTGVHGANRLQLPDRGADHRTAHRGTAGAGSAGAAGPAAAASGRPGGEPRGPAGPGRGHVPARRGGP